MTPQKTFINPFDILKQPNFRYYWLGFTVSVIGTWMQRIAQPWLAYKITGSPLLLSLIGVAQAAPVLVFSLFSGVIVDHCSKKRLLLITQAVSFCITLFLAMLVHFDWIQYWHLLVGALLLGTVNSLDMPGRQSFYIELVEKKDLMSAIGLCSSAFNVARIVGPLIAGVMMVYVSISFCFFVNAASFAVMFLCLSFVNPLTVAIRPGSHHESVLSRITAGFNHVVENKVLLFTLCGMSVIGVFALNFTILLPVLVKTVLKTDASTFSYLMSCTGVGSLIGALLIASTSSSGPRDLALSIVPMILGALILSTGILRGFSEIAFVMVASGLCTVLFTSTSNSVVQLNLDEEFRGRVMSIYILISNGATAIGSFITGVIMENYNVQVAYLVCGGSIIVLIGAVTLARYLSMSSTALRKS